MFKRIFTRGRRTLIAGVLSLMAVAGAAVPAHADPAQLDFDWIYQNQGGLLLHGSAGIYTQYPGWVYQRAYADKDFSHRVVCMETWADPHMNTTVVLEGNAHRPPDVFVQCPRGTFDSGFRGPIHYPNGGVVEYDDLTYDPRVNANQLVVCWVDFNNGNFHRGNDNCLGNMNNQIVQADNANNDPVDMSYYSGRSWEALRTGAGMNVVNGVIPNKPEVVWGNIDVLGTGRTIYGEDTLVSTNGAYQLLLTGSGNIELWHLYGTNPDWQCTNGYRHLPSNTGGQNRLVMQGDGNLVLYNSANQPLWASSWYGQQEFGGGFWAVMQTDGNFVIYSPINGVHPVWASDSMWC